MPREIRPQTEPEDIVVDVNPHVMTQYEEEELEEDEVDSNTPPDKFDPDWTPEEEDFAELQEIENDENLCEREVSIIYRDLKLYTGVPPQYSFLIGNEIKCE